jgi:outer membrane protein OmpA-like peptidoglycan-associated protein
VSGTFKIEKIVQKAIYSTVFILSVFSLAFAANFGTSTADFLKINAEAGPAGMGEANIAVSNGTSALDYNPAGLALLDKAELSGTDILWFNNINMQYGAFAIPMESGSGFGANLMWIDFGSFDSTGGVAPAISIRDGLFNLGYGKSFGKDLHLGVAAKGMYEDYFGTTSFGVSFDAGAIYNLVNRNLFLGVTAKNLGFLSGTSDMLPMEAGLGLGLRLYEGAFDYLNADIDVTKTINTDNFFAGAGIEAYFFKMLAFRLGVKYNNAFDLSEMSFSDVSKLMVFSGGVGINLGDNFSVDYSYTPMGDLGPVQRVTAKFRFGDSLYEQYLAEQNAEFMPKAIEVPQVNVEKGFIKNVSFKPNVPEEKVKEWTLNIKTSDGKILKTFSGVGEVPKNLTWDGTDTVGRISKSDVNYVFDFRAKNLEGQVIKTAGRIMQPKEIVPYEVPADKIFVPLKNEEMLVAPITLLVSSDSDERKQVPFIMVNNRIKSIKSWSFQVYGKDGGTMLKSFEGGRDLPSYLVWDGRDSAGAAVADLKSCRYILEITGTDGNKAVIKDRQVIRDTFVIASKTRRIELARRIYFDKGSTGIMPEMQDRLKAVAQEIKGSTNVQVYIQGHSSEEGSDRQNMLLSQERAKAVLRYLVEQYRISPLSITTVGYGSAVPVNDNQTEEQRKFNRRVEIIIMGEK